MSSPPTPSTIFKIEHPKHPGAFYVRHKTAFTVEEFIEQSQHEAGRLLRIKGADLREILLPVDECTVTTV